MHGRTDIDFYSEHGYAPAPEGSTYDSPQQSARSASRTIEYSRNDFAIALAAHRKWMEHINTGTHYIFINTYISELGNASIYNEYLARANNWVNLWNIDVEEDGFSGFIMPRYQVRARPLG